MGNPWMEPAWVGLDPAVQEDSCGETRSTRADGPLYAQRKYWEAAEVAVPMRRKVYLEVPSCRFSQKVRDDLH